MAGEDGDGAVLALWGTVLWLCLKVAFWVLSLLRSGFMILVDALR